MNKKTKGVMTTIPISVKVCTTEELTEEQRQTIITHLTELVQLQLNELNKQIYFDKYVNV